MELTDVDRALKRPGEYFFEDGLWEIAAGLWIGLTLAVPQLIGGAAGNWAPVVMLFTALGLRPAVLAAKGRWVYPRTGHVTYPDPEELPQARISLGLSPATGPAAGPVPRGRRAYWTAIGLAVAGAAFMGGALAVSRRVGARDAGGHLGVGVFVGGCLLVAAWRWRQRRWIGLAAALVLLGTLMALSGMNEEPALALHAAGVAVALVISGTVAFVRYLRRAPLPHPDAR